jgi:hypothetical protein
MCAKLNMSESDALAAMVGVVRNHICLQHQAYHRALIDADSGLRPGDRMNPVGRLKPAPQRRRRRLGLLVDDEGGGEAGRGGEAALAAGDPARAALHLAQVGVGMHIHLHLAELQLAEGHQREDR